MIANSMLIAGRTAQEYNQRKGKQGAFWKDRYHATAIETDEHLHRCMFYIDLNMVRTGVVNHPAKWKESGFSEIEKPPKRYATIDLLNLIKLSGFADLGDFQRTHRDWVEQALNVTRAQRDVRWSEAVAVGSLAFVEKVKGELNARAIHREFDPVDGGYVLRAPTGFYARRFTGDNETLSSENTLLWEESDERANTYPGPTR